MSRRIDPPNISREDAVALSSTAVRYCRLPHPDVVKRLGSAVFPVVRAKDVGGDRESNLRRRVLLHPSCGTLRVVLCDSQRRSGRRQ